jgi:hypothetical protein
MVLYLRLGNGYTKNERGAGKSSGPGRLFVRRRRGVNMTDIICNNQTIKRKGRPPKAETKKRYQVMLSDKDNETLLELGKGNRSEGIRLATESHKAVLMFNSGLIKYSGNLRYITQEIGELGHIT